MVDRPYNQRHLDGALRRLVESDAEFVEVRSLLANAVVAEMMSGATVKGGSGLKMRFGDDATRFTTDLDVVRTVDLDEFLDKLENDLSIGWEGFKGTLVHRVPATPSGVPGAYVMQPFDVKLSYIGRSWLTVRLEVSRAEAGDADNPDMVSPNDAARYFEKLGFPAPQAIPVMSLDYQIAQKIHALSSPGSQRTHDLIDLQVIGRLGAIDFGETKEACERVFRYRGEQLWPPTIVKGNGWDELYRQQAVGLAVMQDVDDAIRWCNELIGKIAS